MSEPSPVRKCPTCGAALPANAPQGLCPKCLLLGVVAPTEPSLGSAHQRPPPPSRETVAAAFPQLKILELIGQGGMGCVFKARQPQLNRFVALKLLPEALGRDLAFAARFTREAQALAALSHPNIVTIHDFGQSGGVFYLLMEFVDGVNLRQALGAGRFTPEQALSVVPQICDALQYAHDRGIVHRDIKPENILLDRDGRVKIADFGIAKLVGTNASGVPLPHSADARPSLGGAGQGDGETPILTHAGEVVGTPQYMAPEQTATPQTVDRRADIYSLGVVFYEMLTGELPGDKLQPPSRKVQMDVRIDEVVLRALEKTPELRYQTAAELRTQIETVVNTPPPAGPVTPTRICPSPQRTALVLVWTTRILGLLGFLFVLLFVLADGFPPFWKQPAAVQVELTAMVLMLVGLLAGWKREGLGATLLGAGWTTFLAAERGWPPWPFTAFLVVAALYAMGWWRTAGALPGRRWQRELSLALGGIALAALAGVLLSLPGRTSRPPHAAYEKAVASDAFLSAHVGPNRFAVRSVVRNDRGGTLHFEDGRGTLLNRMDFITNPQLVRQAEWLDLVNVSFGVNASGQDSPELYDVIESRVFNHQTRELLGAGTDRWGVGWDLQAPGVLQLRAAGQPLPDRVDVWFRMASHAGTNGQIWLPPVTGATTNLAGGQLTVREVRDGQWGFQQRGSQLSWFEKPMDYAGCTVVLDWSGSTFPDRLQIQVTDAARRGHRVFPPGAPHFVDFRYGTSKVIHFDVPLPRVGAILLRPFGGRHTFYFSGVKLPAISRRTLALPPVVTLRFDGAPGQAESHDLDPVILRCTAIPGRAERVSSLFLENSGLEPDRYQALAGPALETNRYSTVLFRLEGLGCVPVNLTLLDRQGRSLPTTKPSQSTRQLSVSQPGLASAGLNVFALPWDRVGSVQVQVGVSPTTGLAAPPPTPVTFAPEQESATNDLNDPQDGRASFLLKK